MRTGGDAVVAALQDEGVDVVFGLPGVHNLAAWTAFDRSPIRLVGVRHEQTAGYAADGYARATGRLGVAVTTTGPGASNAVTAVGEAFASHSPVLVLATDIPTTMRREGQFRGVLHETTDQASFFRPVTKAQLRARTADEVHALTREAARLAMEHPRRPVYLEIPTDLLSAEAGEDRVREERGTVPEGLPEPAPDVASLLDRLAAAERPLLWVGGGAQADDAGAYVGQLAEALGAPVLTSYGGRGLLPPDHPSLVPLPPHAPEAGALWDAADAVLVLGSDLDAMNTQGFRQPQPPTLLCVGLGDVVTYRPDLHVRTSVTSFLQQLPAADPWTTRREPWFERPVRLLEGAEGGFLEAFEAGLPPDAVVVADMCVPGYWYGGYGRVARPRGLAYPVGWGTLGFGFPAGLGAALSGRPAVALVGDGGFLFACGDLATAAQERLPLVTVLVDDGGYGMLAYDFTKDGEQPVGCDLEPPDFVALAAAFRVRSREVTVDELAAAMRDAIAAGEPALLVVKASYVPPPNTSPRWYRAAR